jgi:hypothetical protein
MDPSFAMLCAVHPCCSRTGGAVKMRVSEVSEVREFR